MNKKRPIITHIWFGRFANALIGVQSEALRDAHKLITRSFKLGNRIRKYVKTVTEFSCMSSQFKSRSISKKVQRTLLNLEGKFNKEKKKNQKSR